MHIHTGVPAEKEGKTENRGLKSSDTQLKKLKQSIAKGWTVFFSRLLWTLTFLKAKREDRQFTLISALNCNSNSGLQAMHRESFSCAILCFLVCCVKVISSQSSLLLKETAS